MPLPTSGLISLNQIHTEAGGSSGTQASINDSDIRGLIGKGSGATSSFSNFYGASSVRESTAYMHYNNWSSGKNGDLWAQTNPYSSLANHPWWQDGFAHTLDTGSTSYNFYFDGAFPASRDVALVSAQRWDTTINKITVSNNYNGNTIVRTSGFVLQNSSTSPVVHPSSSSNNSLPQLRMAIGPITNGTGNYLPQRMGIPTSAINFRVYIKLTA